MYTITIHEDTVKDIIGKFTYIPSEINFLKLNFANIQDKNEGELMAIFENIPAHIKSLDLSNNLLHLLSIDTLTSCLESLPKSLMKVDISINNLPTEGPDFKKIIDAIPTEIENICILLIYEYGKIKFHTRMELTQMIEKNEINEQLFFFKCIAAGSALGGAALLISAMLCPTVPLLFNLGVVLLGVSALTSTGLILNSFFKNSTFENGNPGNADTSSCCFS
jgi:hypothetical protein